jgi:hypothetical protein
MQHPILCINTSSAREGYCAWIGSPDETPLVAEVKDTAAEMVLVLQKLCVDRPASILFLVNSRASYTGMRTGWCIAQGIARAWNAKIWYVRVDAEVSVRGGLVAASSVQSNPLELVYGGD